MEICAKLKEKLRGMCAYLISSQVLHFLSSLTVWPRFLLAALQVDSLKHCTSTKKLRAAVELLPSRLDDLYGFLLQRRRSFGLSMHKSLWVLHNYSMRSRCRMKGMGSMRTTFRQRSWLFQYVVLDTQIPIRAYGTHSDTYGTRAFARILFLFSFLRCLSKPTQTLGAAEASIDNAGAAFRKEICAKTQKTLQGMSQRSFSSVYN